MCGDCAPKCHSEFIPCSLHDAEEGVEAGFRGPLLRRAETEGQGRLLYKLSVHMSDGACETARSTILPIARLYWLLEERLDTGYRDALHCWFVVLAVLDTVELEEERFNAKRTTAAAIPPPPPTTATITT